MVPAHRSAAPAVWHTAWPTAAAAGQLACNLADYHAGLSVVWAVPLDRLVVVGTLSCLMYEAVLLAVHLSHHMTERHCFGTLLP